MNQKMPECQTRLASPPFNKMKHFRKIFTAERDDSLNRSQGNKISLALWVHVSSLSFDLIPLAF